MQVIIAGSRTLNPTDKEIDALIDRLSREPTMILSGAHWEGVDVCGERWATNRGLPLSRYPARWRVNGRRDKGAGVKRNRQMAELADALILIWTGDSRGSRNMKHEAESRGLEIVEEIRQQPPGAPDD